MKAANRNRVYSLAPLTVRIFAAVVFFSLLPGCSAESRRPPAHIRLVGGTELLQAMVKIYNREIPVASFSSSVQRPGAIGAVDALESGQGDAALAGAGVSYTAYTKGTDEVPYPHKSLRGVAVLGVSALHLVTRPGLPFQQMTDLRGKTIAIGPQGSNTDVTARKLLPQFGILESDLQTPTSQEIPLRLADSTLDAHLFVISYPSPTIAADLAVPGTQLVSIHGPEVLKLREKYPYLHPIVIPAGTYAGQNGHIETVGVDLIFVCRSDLGDELVYKMLGALFESVPQLLKADPSVGGITLERAPGTPIPLHPGAARFYREKGLFP